jgi:hypothetical protein
MLPQDPIKLTRDTEVVQIPEGYRVRLARGTEVRMMHLYRFDGIRNARAH